MKTAVVAPYTVIVDGLPVPAATWADVIAILVGAG